MQVHAILKNVPMSPQKMREVVRQIQGLPALHAQAVDLLAKSLEFRHVPRRGGGRTAY